MSILLLHRRFYWRFFVPFLMCVCILCTHIEHIECIFIFLCLLSSQDGCFDALLTRKLKVLKINRKYGNNNIHSKGIVPWEPSTVEIWVNRIKWTQVAHNDVGNECEYGNHSVRNFHIETTGFCENTPKYFQINSQSYSSQLFYVPFSVYSKQPPNQRHCCLSDIQNIRRYLKSKKETEKVAMMEKRKQSTKFID